MYGCVCCLSARRWLAGQAGACRKVWNYFLDKTTSDYRNYQHWRDFRIGPERPKPNVSFYGMGTQFTKLRQDPAYAWLQEYSCHEVRYVLKYLADAYKAFFAGTRAYPRFKSKHHTRDGFTLAYGVKIVQGRLHVPKIGKLQLKGANPYAHYKPKQARICQEGTKTNPKWYAYITYEVPATDVKQGAETGTLGVDRNVGQATDSQGRLYQLTDTARLDAKIRRKQRVKNRKPKGSKRGRRVGGQLRKLQRKRKRIRDNDTHHISRALADRAHTVVLEDLNTAGMTKSAKGTREEPGTHVRQKAGLNREILASGWHQLERKLAYKCGAVAKVDPPAYQPDLSSVWVRGPTKPRIPSHLPLRRLWPAYARRSQRGD